MSVTQTPPIYELGPDFYDEVQAAAFPQGILRYRNQQAARILGLDQLDDVQWKKHFWSFDALPDNIKKPLALRYHGHQFQVYNPQLGDGRGFLFAQVFAGNKLYDLGTKGSGQTPYSRNGDGRLTLKGAFREILATELLESYGVNTSKTFSVFETGESLDRQDEPSPTRSGVLVRMSHSHIRIGTFQRLAYLQQKDNISKLLHYCVRHYYPDLQSHAGAELAAAFLKAVSHALAETCASWMMAGFVHGVLNTDNMNITGESFDYGPYRFLPHYDPSFTAAYFDQSGLYCYGRQPASVLWSLYQLGSSLRVAYPELPIEDVLEDYADVFNFHVHQRLLRRLNLKNPLLDPQGAAELNSELVANLFQFMDQEKALFEQTLFDLHSGGSEERLARSPLKNLYKKESFKNLRAMLEAFETESIEKEQHPYFLGSQACSLLIDELESIWQPIAESDDWTAFTKKLQDIRSFRGVYEP
ncbi:MAG: selenoprotein O [Bdellovibrio sp. ArHS]|uniref:protein adenylyltransferase SelO family protein n=1 Tax=Bdellovibrio sp. ArHS TaxID=1569284 RepID=UPI0005832A10|nr:YdiU family protein [Bdellovibrio sp. ArHS]KHD87894.1 MAG: selenoprotein O [Bdellovibrio sp. ArHS]